MSRPSLVWLLIALGSIVCGVIAWFVVAGRSTPTTQPVGAARSGAESLLIDSANPLEPHDEYEAADLVNAFRKECHKACVRLPGAARLHREQCDSLTEAAAERLAMYLSPSYDEYRAYVKRLTGRDPDGVEAMNIKTSREQFDRQTSALRLIPFDPEAVHVRALFVRGQDLHSQATADCSFTMDVGMFFTETGFQPQKTGATIYEVLVPVDMPDGFDPSSRQRLVLGMAFVLDRGGVWKPWRMGVHDPSGEDRILRAPWL